jgi:hypothetical protein
LEAFTIRGLREHPGEGVFADAAGPSEQQRIGYATAAKHAAKGADDPLIAEKSVKTHQ